MNTNPSSTAKTPEAADLTRLRADDLVLAAELALAEVQLEEVRADYARASGKATLADVAEVEATREATARRLQLHRDTLAAVEAQEAAAAHSETVRALLDELDRTRDNLTRSEAARLRALEEAELQLHEARIADRVGQQEARQKRAHGQQLVARLAALLGRPSPAVAPLTVQEAHEFDTVLARWRLSSSDVPDRMDVFPLETASNPDNAREDHRRRWSHTLVQMSLWPDPVPAAAPKPEP